MARQWQRRRVGSTELEVTTLGLGTASLAGNMNGVSTEQALATIRSSVDARIGYYDTAPFYGFGRAEHLVGDVLREAETPFVLSTKVGRLLRPSGPERTYPNDWVDPLPFDQVYDYSYDGVMRSFEDSLQRLGLATIDILFVHDIGVMTHGVEQNRHYWQQLESGGYRALRELRDSGTIKAIGLGVNEWQVLMDAFALGDWDVFLLAGRYTLLEQTSLSPFLATCLERNASVVIGGPFNSGMLAGGDTFNYAKAPPEVVSKVERLREVCRDHGVNIAAAALQFPLLHPAVCSVIPGPRSPGQLKQILGWWDEEIPAELWTALASEGLLEPGTPTVPGALGR